MNKQEFKDFCHDEFTRRGFKKKRSMYYMKGKDLLCGIDLQKSMAEAFYVNYNFYIGEYDDVKSYPSKYDCDLYHRITVWSKDTVKGEHFWDAMIEYERYTIDEIKPYFDRAFEEYIMPPIEKGKKVILENKDFYFRGVFEYELPGLLEKLNS